MIPGAPIAESAIGDEATTAVGAPIARGMPAQERDIVIVRGDTLQEIFRWEQQSWRSAPIVSITRNAFVHIELAEEVSIPNGWFVAVVDAQGMTDLNAEIDPKTLTPRQRSLRQCTVVDSMTVMFDGISSASFRAHRPNTGYLVWHPPVDLSDYSARLSMKNRYGGALLVPMLTEADGTLVIDPELMTTTAVLDELTTAGMAKGGVYDLEMVSATGIVSKTFFGAVQISNEVTTAPIAP